MHPDARIILKNFCEALEVPEDIVLSKLQTREACDARFLIVTEMKRQFGHLALRAIGEWFKKPRKSAHSFVLYCEKQQKELMVNKIFHHKYLKCQATLIDPSIYNNVPQY